MKKLNFLILCGILAAAAMNAQPWDCGATSGTVSADISISGGETILTITATNPCAMDDFSLGTAPWIGYLTYITHIKIGDDVTSIGDYAFAYCVNLKAVSISDDVITIGDYAFQNCTALSSIALPSFLITIGANAFANCTSLEDICSKATSAPGIQADSFDNIYTDCTLYIPDHLTSDYLNDYISENWGDFFDNIFEFTDAGKCGEFIDYVILVNEEKLILRGIGIISDYSDSGYDNPFTLFRENLKYLEIGDGVSTIGYRAFSPCFNLISVEMSESVKEIKARSFNGSLLSGLDSKLTTIDLKNVEIIGQYAFENCKSLVNVDLRSATSIGQGSFQNCSNLKTVTLSEQSSWISSNVFVDCPNMESIYCMALTPPTIYLNTFDDPPSNYKIYVPRESVETYKSSWSKFASNIEGYDGCPPTIAKATGKISDSATSTDIDCKLCDDGSLYFSGNGELSSLPVTITPNDIISIDIAEGITSIGNTAFQGCSNLETVTLPESVTSIGNNAFNNCSALDNVYVYWNDPDALSFGLDIFDNISATSTLHVPRGTRLKYDAIWDEDFQTIKAYGEFASGKFGIDPMNQTLLWELIKEDETSDDLILTISGSGEMPNYVSGAALWDAYTNDIVDIEILDGVEIIGSYAFENFTSIKEVTIPASITDISPSAFIGCSSLEEIIVDGGNENFESIDGVLFTKDNSRSTPITLIHYPVGKIVQDDKYTIPDDVTAIGDYAFYKCKLAEVEMPDVETIGDYAFLDCYDSGSGDISLLSVDMPKVKTVGNNAFTLCSALSSIDLQNIETIGYAAFSNTSIQDANMQKVKTIGNNAFDYNYNLKSVTLPESVTSIGDYAFDECINLENVYVYRVDPLDLSGSTDVFDFTNTPTLHVPRGTRLKYEAAHVWLNFVPYIQAHGEVASYPFGSNQTNDNLLWEITKENEASDDLTLTISGIGAMHDYGEIFYFRAPWLQNSNANKITTIEIFEDVTNIGAYAFTYCNAEEISIPASIIDISPTAFVGGSLIKFEVDNDNPKYSTDSNGILFNKGQTELIHYPLGKHSTTYTLPNNVKTIGDFAFFGYWALTSIDMNLVEYIGENAFSNCFFSSADLQSVKTIGAWAFSNCSHLSEVKMNNVEMIDDYAFLNCGDLFEVEMSKVKYIGDFAFSSCANLDEVEMPLVKYIGKNAFQYCADLSSVDMSSVEVLDEWAFVDCIKLKKVDMPNIKIIGENAFNNCITFQEVHLPSSVTEIGESAFAYCTSLESVYVNWDDPSQTTSFGNYIFDDIAPNPTLFVPPGKKEEYDITDLTAPWNVFTNLKGYVSGKEGNLSWVISEDENRNDDDDETHTLYISGADIPDFDDFGTNDAPWKNYSLFINSIEIGSDVETIGDFAFQNCTSLVSIDIPETVTFIGTRVFADCSSLENINVDENNNDYAGIEGVLFTKGTPKTLIHYPAAKSGDTYQIPDDVEILVEYAFEGSENLETVKIPASVDDIREFAFANCTSLESVYLDWDVSTPRGISEDIFDGCWSVPSATLFVLPGTKNLYNISDNTSPWFGFQSKKGYVSGKDGDLSWVISEDDSKKDDDEETHTFNITGTDPMSDFDANGGNDAPWVNYLSFINKIEIENGVENIGNYAFANCENLTEVEIGSGVATIGDYAFSGCDALQTINIPASVETIGNRVFADCSALKEIVVATTNLNYENTINENNQSDGVLFAKAQTNPIKQKTLIHYPAAKDDDAYQIPDDVKILGEYAFEGSENLETVKIPASVDDIREFAFANCTSLESVYLDWDVTTLRAISEDIFDGCWSVPSATLFVLPGTKNLYNISENNSPWFGFQSKKGYVSGKDGDLLWVISEDDSKKDDDEETHTFNITGTDPMSDFDANGGNDAPWINYLSFINKIEIENGVTSIGDYAFANCENLTEVEIGEDVENIGYLAFGECSGLKDIKVHSDNSSFADEYGVLIAEAKTTPPTPKTLIHFPIGKTVQDNNYTIPTSVIAIGANAFSGCKLTEVDMLNVVSIDSMAFLNSSTLASVLMPNVTSIDLKAFSGCTALANVVMPNVTSIGNFAFLNCSTLSEIDLEKIQTIGYGAFQYNTNLHTIKFASSLVTIGDTVFCGCNNLKKIYSYKAVPPSAQDSTFKGVHADCILFVPFGSTGAYEEAQGWKYLNIEEIRGSLHGVVTEQRGSNQFPIENAKVELFNNVGLVNTATTNDVGYYVFSGDLPTGSYQITVSADCFVEESEGITIIDGDNPHNVELARISCNITIASNNTNALVLFENPPDGYEDNPSQDYSCGNECRIKASIDDLDYHFVRWEEEMAEASPVAHYEFPVDRDRYLTAIFAKNEVYGFNPASTASTGNLTITLFGSGFSETTKIFLFIPHAHDTYQWESQSYNLINVGKIEASFSMDDILEDLPDYTLNELYIKGYYSYDDNNNENPDFNFETPIYVEPSAPGSLAFQIQGPPGVEENTWNYYNILVTNTGNTMIENPFITVEVKSEEPSGNIEVSTIYNEGQELLDFLNCDIWGNDKLTLDDLTFINTSADDAPIIHGVFIIPVMLPYEVRSFSISVKANVDFTVSAWQADYHIDSLFVTLGIDPNQPKRNAPTHCIDDILGDNQDNLIIPEESQPFVNDFIEDIVTNRPATSDTDEITPLIVTPLNGIQIPIDGDDGGTFGVGSPIESMLFNSHKKSTQTPPSKPRSFENCPAPPEAPEFPVIIVPIYEPSYKIGYRSPSGSQWFNDDVVNMTYLITFGNDSESIPVDTVTIRDVIDPLMFDLQSFRAGHVQVYNKFDNVLYNTKEHTYLLDFRPDDKMLARVELTFDTDTGNALWQFSSINPSTGEATQDEDFAFLQPNNEFGRGSGSVSFSINLRNDLINEFTVYNQAIIKLGRGEEEPDITNLWFNRKDIIAPTSKVNENPTIDGNEAYITWQGSDQEPGSGVWYYDIYVAEDDDDGNYNFMPWKSRIKETEAKFVGENSKKYYFYSIATDMAGNVELLDSTKIVEVELDVSIKELSSSDKPRLYPNPTTGIVYISCETTIKVYNIQGVLLFETYSNKADLSPYPTGIYIFKVGDHWTKVVKK